MNPESARELFDRALDGELDPTTRADFEAALSADPALREDYLRLERVRQAAAKLAQSEGPVDLLAGVQQKLRARSGGKFYRDRFAEQRGRNNALMWVLMVVSALVILVAVWFVFTSL